MCLGSRFTANVEVTTRSFATATPVEGPKACLKPFLAITPSAEPPEPWSSLAGVSTFSGIAPISSTSTIEGRRRSDAARTEASTAASSSWSFSAIACSEPAGAPSPASAAAPASPSGTATAREARALRAFLGATLALLPGRELELELDDVLPALHEQLDLLAGLPRAEQVLERPARPHDDAIQPEDEIVRLDSRLRG